MSALQQLVEAARQAVAADPRHDLTLGRRQAIWAAFGPRGDAAQPTDAWRARTRLAISTARQVLDLWERARPEDHVVRQAIESADDLVDDPAQIAEARAFRDHVLRHLDHLAARTPVDVVSAGYAGAMALDTAIHDHAFDPANLDDRRTDGDIDSEYLDASFHAANAFANGTIWDAASDADARRTFWMWWLDQVLRLGMREGAADR